MEMAKESCSVTTQAEVRRSLKFSIDFVKDRITESKEVTTSNNKQLEIQGNRELPDTGLSVNEGLAGDDSPAKQPPEMSRWVGGQKDPYLSGIFNKSS